MTNERAQKSGGHAIATDVVSLLREEEEQEIFPKIETLTIDFEDLGSRMAERKQELMEQVASGDKPKRRSSRNGSKSRSASSNRSRSSSRNKRSHRR